MKPKLKSYTAIQLFLDCERRYFLERVEGRPIPPSVYLSVGNLYHSVLEKCVKQSLSVEAAYDEEYEKHSKYKNWVCPTPVKNLRFEVVHNVRRTLNEVVNKLAIEKVEVRIGPAKLDLVSLDMPVVVEGKVESVEFGEPCVLDYKVRFGSRRRNEWDIQHSLQLGMYAFLADVRAAAYIEIPRNTLDPLSVLVKQFTDEDLEYWERYAQEQSRAIESRGQEKAAFRLAAPGHTLCSPRWCPHFGDCEGGANGS